MHKNPFRFEQPERVKELDMTNTLLKVGLKEGDVFGDFGAGTGIFSFEAYNITMNTVYAMDINDDMLNIINDKKTKESLEDIVAVKIKDYPIDISNDTLDHMLLSTVYHEIDDKEKFFAEVKRLLKTGGHIGIIEFIKKDSPMGPPIHERVSPEELSERFEREGFKTLSTEVLGDNMYLAVFEK